MTPTTIIVNPHYVARLLGSIALAREMTQQDNLFELIDFANTTHVNVLIEELIQPEYLRMTGEWRYKTKESLRYLLQTEPGDVVSQICEMIGLTENQISAFLKQIWQILFPVEVDSLLPGMKYSKKIKPIKSTQIQFETSPRRNFEEALEMLRIRLNVE